MLLSFSANVLNVLLWQTPIFFDFNDRPNNEKKEKLFRSLLIFKKSLFESKKIISLKKWKKHVFGVQNFD